MSSISGLEGLEPTINIIMQKKLQLLIKNQLSVVGIYRKNYLKINQFIPVDSEHFSIWCGLEMKIIIKIFI